MKTFLLRLLALAVAAAFGGVLFAWSGLYSVAATSGHFPMVRWFLHYAMQRSVATHALLLEAPPLDDPALVRRAAGHFAIGCEPCHGAPGIIRNKVPLQMLPQPPRLGGAVDKYQPRELFWIVRHGLKYTGMPGWPAPEREDEVWAMVAFLRELPEMSPQAYAALAAGSTADRPGIANELGFGASDAAPLDGCARCHGLDGVGDPDGAFPRLDIQTPRYLARALADYAAGLRPSGTMEPMAHGLTKGQIASLAEHFGRRAGAGAVPQDTDADPRLVEEGRAIATGTADAGIPACASCHGLADGPANPAFPALAGQYPGFIANQLRLWQKDVRGTGAYSSIMETVASSLGEEQIRAVAAFYASLARAPSAAAPEGAERSQ